MRTLLLATTLIAAPVLAQTTPAPQAPATTAAPAAQAPVATTTAPQTPAAIATPAPAPAGTATIGAALPTLAAHATLARLVTAAELGPVLSGPGPFTVFAPNDTAFSRLPAGTLDTLTAPSNKAGLQTILKNHVVSGALTEAQIRQQITAGGGRATLTTLAGQPLVASLENNVVLLTDPLGNKSFIDKADLRETNGVIHSMNGISLPKLG